MSSKKQKRIPYGVSNYAEMVRKNCYFIDKTEYIEKLELVQNPIFLRPKRFGKSLFCSMLGHYYDLRHAERFDDFVQYFNEIHHIDVSTRYAPLMQRFVNQPSLSKLFTGYWEE